MITLDEERDIFGCRAPPPVIFDCPGRAAHRDDAKNKPTVVMGDMLVDATGVYKALTEDTVSIFGKDLHNLQKQKFADVCKAIGMPRTAVMLDLMGTLCDRLVAKVK